MSNPLMTNNMMNMINNNPLMMNNNKTMLPYIL